MSRLSTGEKQRFALIRALALNSPVLLLDEPTGPLDPDSVAAVEQIPHDRLSAGVSILLVTHDPGQADRMGHRRYRMAHGHLEAA